MFKLKSLFLSILVGVSLVATPINAMLKNGARVARPAVGLAFSGIGAASARGIATKAAGATRAGIGKKAFVIGALGVAGAAALYYDAQQTFKHAELPVAQVDPKAIAITDFVDAKDKPFVMGLCKKHYVPLGDHPDCSELSQALSMFNLLVDKKTTLPAGSGIYVKIISIEGKPVGYVQYALGLNAVAERPEKSFGYISNIAIAKRYQGKGLGKQLLAYAEEDLKQRGCQIMQLRVNAEKEDLIKWYNQQGYGLLASKSSNGDVTLPECRGHYGPEFFMVKQF